ncbi:MAG TPA: thiamine biosynthesis protein ThiF [Sulfurospirillum cavolei]|uniref:Thiamine biosynthesis protein ThiF n=1 Tax=Sulfurospirillum cavolei TaxID=366522 RepID=A0A2D3W6G9_9BACT|nr:MAG TPA: thiamine biosynthesis protein ThiF [Sulfurospirillum cavolei]
MELLDFLHVNQEEGFLPLAMTLKAAKEYGMSFRDVEIVAMNEGIMPLRYKRNVKSLCVQEQLTLLQSNVLIVGCGGLGGFVAELLTRIGVGNIHLFDGDVFEEHNLNRQIGATVPTLGKNKAQVLAERLMQINPSLHVSAYPEFFSLDHHSALLETIHVTVDALDDPTFKKVLARWTYERHMSFVHAAIAGMTLECSTNRCLEELYPTEGKGAETLLGNLAFTVACAAALQSAEVVKLLLHRPHLDQTLFMDLKEYETVLF